MSSSPNERTFLRAAAALLGAAALAACAGCIADTAEDSDLPWARNQGWEGMVPLPSNVMDRYD